MQRLARILLLAALTTLAAMAFLTTSAFAQSIELHPEDNATHCSDVEEGAAHTATGGCLFHMVNDEDIETFQHTGVSEVLTNSCEIDLTGRIGEDGTGYFVTSDASIHTDGTDCFITPCDEAAPSHVEVEWPINGMSEIGGSRSEIELTMCIRPFSTAEGSAGTRCTVSLVVTDFAHQQELSADSEPCEESPLAELTGTWLTEAVLGAGEVELEPEHIHYP